MTPHLAHLARLPFDARMQAYDDFDMAMERRRRAHLALRWQAPRVEHRYLLSEAIRLWRHYAQGGEEGGVEVSARLYLDIETIPTEDPSVMASIADSISLPGNISKAETIAAWEAEKKPALVTEAVARTALSGLHGRVCCIGWAWDDGAPKSVLFPESEFTTLTTAFARISLDAPQWGNPVIIGHNVANFDIRFLWQRAFVHGAVVPSWLPRNVKPWSNEVFDTMAAWAGTGTISLDNLCKALGVPGKGEVDGSMVAGMWQRGEFDAIQGYCRSDVERVRNVHRKMRLAFGEAA